MKYVDEAARATLQALDDDLDLRAERDPEGRDEDHALWMLNQIQTLQVTGNKAHRWLGYAQALLVKGKCLTLEKVKEVNKKVSDGEETSEEIGSIASRLLNHPDPDVRKVAGSALTQRPDRRG